MKVLVAHEGKQHSFRTAAALYENGYLYKYITTVYDKRVSLTWLIKYFLSGDLRKKSKTRKASFPDEKVVQFCELRGLLYLVLIRISFLRPLFLRYKNYMHKSFGKKVAYYAIKHNVDAVIMYDTNATDCWRILNDKAPGIKRIMDVSIANRLFMKNNYINDIKRTGDINLQIEQSELWNEQNLKRYLYEIQMSHFFFVASNVSKKSLHYSGVRDEQIYMAPYGVDAEKFSFYKKENATKPLKLLYVGQITYRKGMHHLLKVVSEFPQGDVELYLAGGNLDVTAPFYKQYKDKENIHFLGFVTRDVLAKYYQELDVFVFPTLGEGYGLVILEALSTGMPCIVSNLAGGDDAIIDGENGFVFEGGNDKELKEKIQWFIDNPNALPNMSLRCRESVLKQTWSSYNQKVISALNEICNIYPNEGITNSSRTITSL